MTRYLIEETIEYIIDADDEDDARQRWELLATPQVEALDGTVIYTETQGINRISDSMSSQANA